MSNHSTVVGGSSAARVVNCPASVRLSQEIPPSPTSSYAAEGTALHAVMEHWLLHEPKWTADDLVGSTWEGVEITTDLYHNKITPAMDATNEAFNRFDVGEFEPEAQVHFSSIEGAFGTCDIIGTGRDDLVVLLDYKFGDGVLISPVENKQLMFYAAAAMEDPACADMFTGDLDQPVMLGIIQPAQEHTLRTWETTVRAVTQFQMELMVAVGKSDNPDLPPRAGDWCRWCPAAPVCPAKLNAASAIDNLKDEHLHDLAVAMELAEDLEPWIKQVRKMAHEQLEAGAKVEGYKLVKKRASRKWLEEKDTLAKLKRMKKLVAEDYSTVKILTPPQLEKKCKSKGVDFKQFSDMIVSVSTGTTIAPADDPREGITVSAQREIPDNLANAIKQTQQEKPNV
jgi:hypothetical protein